MLPKYIKNKIIIIKMESTLKMHLIDWTIFHSDTFLCAKRQIYFYSHLLFTWVRNVGKDYLKRVILSELGI